MNREEFKNIYKDCKEKGFTDEQIIEFAQGAGMTKEDANSYLVTIKKDISDTQGKPIKEKGNNKQLKYVFLFSFLLIIVASVFIGKYDLLKRSQENIEASSQAINAEEEMPKKIVDEKDPNIRMIFEAEKANSVGEFLSHPIIIENEGDSFDGALKVQYSSSSDVLIFTSGSEIVINIEPGKTVFSFDLINFRKDFFQTEGNYSLDIYLYACSDLKYSTHYPEKSCDEALDHLSSEDETLSTLKIDYEDNSGEIVVSDEKIEKQVPGLFVFGSQEAIDMGQKVKRPPMKPGDTFIVDESGSFKSPQECPACENCKNGKQRFVYGVNECRDCLFDSACVDGALCLDDQCVIPTIEQCNQSSQKERCIKHLAIINNNHEMCSAIKDDGYAMNDFREQCYVDIAIKQDSLSVCDAFLAVQRSSAVNKYNCHKRLAIHRADNDICTGISYQEQRLDCERKVSVAKEYPDLHHSNIAYWSWTMIAKKTNNNEYCEYDSSSFSKRDCKSYFAPVLDEEDIKEGFRTGVSCEKKSFLDKPCWSKDQKCFEGECLINNKFFKEYFKTNYTLEKLNNCSGNITRKCTPFSSGGYLDCYKYKNECANGYECIKNKCIHTDPDAPVRGYLVEGDQVFFDENLIENVDIESFKILESFFAEDNQNIFFEGIAVEGATPGFFLEITSRIDPTNKIILWADKQSIYRNEEQIVADVEGDRLEDLGWGYWSDGKSIFYTSSFYTRKEGLIKIENADAETFEHVHAHTAKDKNFVYQFGKKIE